jgi:hypothetical protein
MKELTPLKKLIAGLLLLLVAVTLCVIFFYKDELFKQTLTITYPDRCIEVYENNVLTTPECTAGRELKKQQEDRFPGMTGIYYKDLPNITIQ